ncbi:MAG: hypothetical protein ACTHNW_19675, partial [Mucilaginibacter sp.]
MKRRKLRLFKAIAIAIPFVFLILLELLLRVFGYGHNTSLFIRYPDDTSYWVMNKYASERFFSDTGNATEGTVNLFKAQKPPKTCRIFVLGESTTVGYPYFHNGSFHRWLQFRLMHTYPDVHFEIINLSLTAVNSYTVVDFGKQLLKYQPDALLCYVGHNEYYGALGIGSTSHIANNRFLVKAILKLRYLRVVQLMQSLVNRIRSISGNTIDTRNNLMQRMAAKQKIAYQSTEYTAGITQFHDNMEELCQLMQENKVPLFLSTLVSNEKDLKPFINGDGNGESANQQFTIGDSAYKAGDFVRAKQAYDKAKELDMLRFRAPEAMNVVIRQLAQKYSLVHLVDTKQIFEQHSPHGILGSETLLEHVHPNLYGYALMSEAFYESIQQARLIKYQPENEMSFNELLKQMPVTRIDSL